MAKFLLFCVDSITWLQDDNQLCVTKFQKLSNLCIEHVQKHVQKHQIETVVSTLKKHVVLLLPVATVIAEIVTVDYTTPPSTPGTKTHVDQVPSRRCMHTSRFCYRFPVTRVLRWLHQDDTTI